MQTIEQPPPIIYLDNPSTYRREGADIICDVPDGSQLFRFTESVALSILTNLAQTLGHDLAPASQQDPELHPLLVIDAMQCLMQLLESSNDDIDPGQLAALLRLIHRPI